MGEQQAGDERCFSFMYRERPFVVAVDAKGTLELYLDGILRKDRPYTGKVPQYVWTNVELQWEEHHYIEVRYWPAEQRLQVTVNREPLHDLILEAPV